MPTFFRPALTVALSFCLALPLAAQDKPTQERIDPGAYLAARIAGSNDDYRAAAQWYTRALIASPDNTSLMEGALAAQLGAGNLDAAIAVAHRLKATGATSQPADIALIADLINRQDYAALIANLDGGQSIGLLLDGLVGAWAELGTGQMSKALEAFDKLAQTKGLEVFGLYHKALALASVGDFEGAENILSGQTAGSFRVLRRGTIARAQILSQLERNDDAIALLDQSFSGEADPAITSLRARLVAGEPIPFTITRNVTDGMAEVFFSLAVALNGEASDGYTLIYSRVAAWLRPDHAEAQILSGTLLENQKQYDLASEAYAKVSHEDGSFFAAEIGRAGALRGADKPEAALEVLTALTRSHPDLISVHISLGDMLRRDDRWAEATAAYDNAIAMVPAGDAGYWSVYYSRAIALERQKLWDRAELDFRKALALEPDQPQVLNYLGYSYLERGENLEEALSMIEKAVAARPDSGYIIDSLAWGYFLAGRYQDAVAPMERASVLEPVDPTVTDHLGDVYWAVGRTLEANFQWRRALSFDPDEEMAARIRRKLEIGLDAVLVEEGARSLSDVANDR
jgi:tetratricopeptide (TPR) repeat protein